jgi:predicted nuclease with TOPRIM domain
MNDDQYKVLLSEIRECRDEVQQTRDETARIDRDLTKDRNDLGDFRVRLQAVENQIESMRRLIMDNQSNMKDSVQDALRPAVRQVTALTNEIKKKRSIIITRGSLIDQIKNFIKEVRK